MDDEVEVRPDGTRHLIRGESPFRIKAREHLHHHRKMAVVCHEAKMTRIAVKSARQKNKGWPSDKSPI